MNKKEMNKKMESLATLEAKAVKSGDDSLIQDSATKTRQFMDSLENANMSTDEMMTVIKSYRKKVINKIEKS